MAKSELDFLNFMDINRFYQNSALNDNIKNGKSNGILRQSRFVGIIKLPPIRRKFPQLGHNNEITDETDGGWGNEFLAWNITKIKCPAFELGIGSKEVDMMPRHYFKNWTNEDLQISYLETSDLKMRHMFFEWMESCLTVKGYVRQYYDDVKSDWFTIYPLNYQGGVDRYEIFRDLVPYKIDSVEYDISSDDESLVHTTVSFKYLKHELLSFPANPVGKTIQQSKDKFTNLKTAQ